MNDATILPSNASDLIATPDGGLELALAHSADEADFALSFQLLCAVLLRSKDPEWTRKMISWLQTNEGEPEP